MSATAEPLNEVKRIDVLFEEFAELAGQRNAIDVPPCPGPSGERADWWWYTPYDPTRN